MVIHSFCCIDCKTKTLQNKIFTWIESQDFYINNIGIDYLSVLRFLCNIFYILKGFGQFLTDINISLCYFEMLNLNNPQFIQNTDSQYTFWVRNKIFCWVSNLPDIKIMFRHNLLYFKYPCLSSWSNLQYKHSQNCKLQMHFILNLGPKRRKLFYLCTKNFILICNQNVSAMV